LVHHLLVLHIEEKNPEIGLRKTVCPQGPFVALFMLHMW
jgi:hypothetical protein